MHGFASGALSNCKGWGRYLPARMPSPKRGIFSAVGQAGATPPNSSSNALVLRGDKELMTFPEAAALLPPAPITGQGGRFYGVYVAIVTDVQDPDGLGRVRVRLPWTTDSDGSPYDTWARIATLMAGNNRGTWFIPEPDDEVLVAFEAGDPRSPIIVGGLWNGVDTPPEQMDSDNNIRSITSRSGIRVTFRS